MFQLSNNPGRTTICNQKEYLFFSGYAYLGVQHHENRPEKIRHHDLVFGHPHRLRCLS